MGGDEPPVLPDFPKKRCSVAALISDDEARILVVKPSYRSEWLLPGGIVELDESPIDCLIREVREELGVGIQVHDLACVDYLKADHRFAESVHLMFECSFVDATSRDLRPDGREIVEADWMDWNEAKNRLAPTIVRRLEHRGAFYLEDGTPRTATSRAKA